MHSCSHLAFMQSLQAAMLGSVKPMVHWPVVLQAASQCCSQQVLTAVSNRSWLQFVPPVPVMQARQFWLASQALIWLQQLSPKQVAHD